MTRDALARERAKAVRRGLREAERFRDEQQAALIAAEIARDDDEECTPCTYCGVVAQSVDHVVPQWLLKRAEAANLDLSRMFRMRSWTVPACIECNSSLGNRVFQTIALRRAAAKQHVRRKYKAFLRIPNWSADELAEMAPAMVRSIQAGIRVRDWVRQRLAWTGVGRDVELAPVYEVARRTFGAVDQEPGK